MSTIELPILIGLLPTRTEKDFVFPDDLPQQPTESKPYMFPWLYALAKNGNLRTYRIQVFHYEDHSVINTLKATIEGGKWQTDTYEYWEGVNIGKSNETTFSEQAMREAESMYKRLLDAGFSPTKPSADQKYNTDANGFMKPMLASSFNENRIEYPCIVQPKYDGVRCLIFEEDGEVHIQSRKGKPYNIPHIQKWAENHRHLLPLDGELYNHKELTFQEIVSAVKRQSEITPNIRYVVYDRPVENETNDARWKWLLEKFDELVNKDRLAGTTSPVYLSDADIAFDRKQLDKFHDRYVSQGYEGAIIRNTDGLYEFGFRSHDLIKLKHFMEEEFKIIDVIEASGRDAGTAIFVCKCKAGEFNVKPQGSRELRAEYFTNRKKLIGKKATVKFQEYSDDGIPRFPTAKAVRDYE